MSRRRSAPALAIVTILALGSYVPGAAAPAAGAAIVNSLRMGSTIEEAQGSAPRREAKVAEPAGRVRALQVEPPQASRPPLARCRD